MKLLFDGSSMQGSSHTLFHGGGEYAKFILREAIARGYRFDIVFSSRLITDPAIEELLKQKPNYKTYVVADKQELYELIDTLDYDAFYSALPYIYSDYRAKARLVGVIHGLRSIELSWDDYRYQYYNSWYARLVARLINKAPCVQAYLKKKHWQESHHLLSVPNARFITVSNHSKYALLNFYPFLKEEDVRVFYSPFSIEEDTAKQDVGDYYLMVSGNRFEKNTYRAIQAFDKLFTDGRLEGKRVIITGCGKQPFWKRIKNINRFELLPYISTQELEQLYREAFCFVYPSLNEGFGYPPLKAMGYGVPVIASSATSIPEICADAACYFSPTSIDDLCNRILQLYYDEDLRIKLSRQGRKRVAELLEMQRISLNDMFEYLFNQ